MCLGYGILDGTKLGVFEWGDTERILLIRRIVQEHVWVLEKAKWLLTGQLKKLEAKGGLD